MMRDMGQDVVLQINMHPNDARHVAHVLPHQIRTWGGQVDRIVIALDLHRSRAGRYRNNDFDQNYRAIMKVLERTSGVGRVEVAEVDYSPDVRREVARSFFSSATIPDKAWDGGPFYSYFYGLWASRAAYVMHMDSDMLYGGGSSYWLTEAIEELDRRPELIFMAPLSGPPRKDHRLLGQRGWSSGLVKRDAELPDAYLFGTVSTRVFLMGSSQLRERMGALALTAPRATQRMRARVMGNPPQALEAETVLSQNMQARGLARMDMLGTGKGMWSLHPPFRSELLYRELPRLIEDVEDGRIPAEQRGRYDVHDSMIDWSEQRRANARHRRWMRHVRQLTERIRPLAG
jgi:hypothetical protein